MYKYYYLNEYGRFDDYLLDKIEQMKVFDKRTAIHSEQIMAYGIILTSKEIPFESMQKNGLIKCVIDEEEYLRGLLG